MIAQLFAAFLALGILGLPAFTVASRNPQTGSPEVPRKEPKVVLPAALLQLGKSCGCFFTIEEGWTNDESVNSMEAAYVPEYLLQRLPQDAIDAIRVVVPNFTYEVDKVDPRIVHIKDKRLAAIKPYALDQTIGPFEFQGEKIALVEAIAKLGVNITPHAFIATNEMVDSHSQIHVKGGSMQVRAALSNFIPLEQKVKGQFLWVARTRLDSKDARTTVHFL
jgi:hypothetical protein